MVIKNIFGLTNEEYEAHKNLGFLVDFDPTVIDRIQKLMAHGMSIKEIAEHDAGQAFKKATKDKTSNEINETIDKS